MTLKHRISPTTNRRESRDRATIVHLSKALVQRVARWINGKRKDQYLPLHLTAPPGAAVRIVVAPDRGITYRRDEDFDRLKDRPGLCRRYALSGRELTVDRFNTWFPKPVCDTEASL